MIHFRNDRFDRMANVAIPLFHYMDNVLLPCYSFTVLKQVKLHFWAFFSHPVKDERWSLSDTCPIRRIQSGGCKHPADCTYTFAPVTQWTICQLYIKLFVSSAIDTLSGKHNYWPNLDLLISVDCFWTTVEHHVDPCGNFSPEQYN